MSLAELKTQARAAAQARRGRAHDQAGPDGAEALARHVLGCGAVADGAAVAGYWPIADEIDVRPLLDKLAELHHPLALPVVVGRGAPLAFRAWRPGDRLEDGPLGTRHPGPASPDTTPDVMIVPMLAFDDDGYRLGYGGGYYDRTIAALRPAGARAIGVAYEAQRLDQVPHDDHDMRLDWIVTERAAHAVAGATEAVRS